MFTVFEKLRESIMSEVYRLQPKKVVVTGKQDLASLFDLFDTHM